MTAGEYVFSFEGRKGHEVMFVYRVDPVADERFTADPVAGRESEDRQQGRGRRLPQPLSRYISSAIFRDRAPARIGQASLGTTEGSRRINTVARTGR